MVSYAEEPELEQDLNFYPDSTGAEGTIEGTIELRLECAECGAQLKEASFEVEQSVEGIVHNDENGKSLWAELIDPTSLESAEHELIELGNAEDRFEVSYSTRKVDKRSGKPHPRGTTYYGYQLDVTLECSCGELFHLKPIHDDMPASEMDDSQ